MADVASAAGPAVGSGVSLVDTVAAGLVRAVEAPPRSRRAAASTTQDAVACTGADGVRPVVGRGAESTSPAGAASSTVAGCVPAGSAAASDGPPLAAGGSEASSPETFSGGPTGIGGVPAGAGAGVIARPREDAAFGWGSPAAAVPALVSAPREVIAGDGVVSVAEPECAVLFAPARPGDRAGFAAGDFTVEAESFGEEIES